MSTGVIRTETVLDRILVQTAKDLAQRKVKVPEVELTARIDSVARVPLTFAEALDGDNVAVIAEMKRGSPSRGIFPVEVNPGQVAGAYRRGGAAAISCLTDGPYFHGSQQDLETVAEIAHQGDGAIPVIRKDFIIDRYQLLEAKAWGADAVLLIVAALDDELFNGLYQQSGELGMSVLVEVHDEREAARALRLDPPVIGVNNRDLRSFDVDLEVTERIATLIPHDTLLVSESGVFTADDVKMVAAWGVDAVLVGESIITQRDREAAVKSLSGVPRLRCSRGKT